MFYLLLHSLFVMMEIVNMKSTTILADGIEENAYIDSFIPTTFLYGTLDVHKNKVVETRTILGWLPF